MLNNDRLQQLLRDAHALESFERGETASRSAPRRRSTRWVIAVAALIALYVGVQLTLDIAATPKQPVKMTGAKPKSSDPVAPPTASLLLAVYQNDSGHLSCVNWSADALKGRAMSSLTAEELTRLGLALACDPQAARILVVGLEGPAAALPSSDDRAKLVGQCLSTSPPCASGVFNPTTCASAGCLDHQVKVRIESLALK
jgi:hypothetical protein